MWDGQEDAASKSIKEAKDTVFWLLFTISLAGTIVLAAVSVIGGISDQSDVFRFVVGIVALVSALVGIVGVFVKRARYRMCSVPIVFAAVYLAIFWAGKLLG